MNISWGVFLAFLLIFTTFIGVPAFFVGWRRPRLEPRPTQFVVLISVVIFSAFVAFVPQFQRDWFILAVGTIGLGVFGGFLGFVLVVNIAEFLRTSYPSSELFAKFLKSQKKC